MYKKNLQADVSCEIKNIIEADDIESQTLWQAVFLFPIGTEDHQMLLPVTGSQSPSSETLLRSAVTGYSEPQFIFLQQLYWQSSAELSR